MIESIRREQVEDFIYRETELLDEWRLSDWLGCWSEGEICYEVGPTGEDDIETVGPREMLYLVADNRFRLEQRVVRMQKKSAHAEYPGRSRTLHLCNNVRLLGVENGALEVQYQMLVSRAKPDSEGVTLYPGKVLASLVLENGELKLRSKKIVLRMERLSNPGTLTIIL